MKSTKVYQAIREIVAPWCKTHGFKRVKSGVLAYYYPLEGGKYLVFWFQCDPSGWDTYAGSGFVLEFQISDAPIIGQGDQRIRLPLLLSEVQIENLRLIQNRVIAHLSLPPQDYWTLQLPPNLVQMYLERFNPVAKNELNLVQFWHRYASAEDVNRWAVFILDLLPGAIKRFAPDIPF